MEISLGSFFVRPCTLENSLNASKCLWEGTVSLCLCVCNLECPSNPWSLLVEGLTHPFGCCGSGSGAGNLSPQSWQVFGVTQKEMVYFREIRREKQGI